MYVYIYRERETYIYICIIYIYIYIHTYIHTYTYTHTCIYVYIYIHICIYIHIYIYIYTYAYIYIYTYIHTYVQLPDACRCRRSGCCRSCGACGRSAPACRAAWRRVPCYDPDVTMSVLFMIRMFFVVHPPFRHVFCSFDSKELFWVRKECPAWCSGGRRPWIAGCSSLQRLGVEFLSCEVAWAPQGRFTYP